MFDRTDYGSDLMELSLPSRALIPVWDVAREMAKKARPDRRKWTGAALIDRKVVRATGMELVMAMSDADRRLVAHPELPHVNGASSQQERDAYLAKFAALHPELHWHPYIPTASELWAEAMSSYELLNEYQTSMFSAAARAQVKLRDARGRIIHRPGFGAQLPRHLVRKAASEMGFRVPRSRPPRGIDSVCESWSGRTVQPSEAVAAPAPPAGSSPPCRLTEPQIMSVMQRKDEWTVDIVRAASGHPFPLANHVIEIWNNLLSQLEKAGFKMTVTRAGTELTCQRPASEESRYLSRNFLYSRLYRIDQKLSEAGLDLM